MRVMVALAGERWWAGAADVGRALPGGSVDSAAELGGVVRGDHLGAGVDVRLDRLAVDRRRARPGAPSSPILAGNWATEASWSPATIAATSSGPASKPTTRIVLAGALDRLEGADDRRAAGAVDRRDVGVGGEDVLRGVEALGLVAVGGQRGHDLEAVAERLLEAGDPVVERRRCRRRPARTAMVSPGCELLGQELAGEHAAGEVVGGDDARTCRPSRGCRCR